MMQIEIKIDEKCIEPKIIVVTSKMVEERLYPLGFVRISNSEIIKMIGALQSRREYTFSLRL